MKVTGPPLIIIIVRFFVIYREAEQSVADKQVKSEFCIRKILHRSGYLDPDPILTDPDPPIFQLWLQKKPIILIHQLTDVSFSQVKSSSDLVNKEKKSYARIRSFSLKAYRNIVIKQKGSGSVTNSRVSDPGNPEPVWRKAGKHINEPEIAFCFNISRFQGCRSEIGTVFRRMNIFSRSGHSLFTYCLKQVGSLILYLLFHRYMCLWYL